MRPALRDGHLGVAHVKAVGAEQLAPDAAEVGVIGRVLTAPELAVEQLLIEFPKLSLRAGL